MGTINEEKVAELAAQVKLLQDSVDMWAEAGIPRHTIVVLLHHYTKIPQRTIKRVLEGIDNLHDYYFTEDDE